MWETYQRKTEKFCATLKETPGTTLEDGWETPEHIMSKVYLINDHLEREPAEHQPQPLYTMMAWWAPSLVLLSLLNKSDWGSSTNDIWKYCARLGIGLQGLALSAVSYLLPNWVSGLKSGLMLSTQTIASSYKSCVHSHKAPCPFLCIIDGDSDIFLWGTVRRRHGKEKHEFSSVENGLSFKSRPVNCIFQCVSQCSKHFSQHVYQLNWAEFLYKVLFCGNFGGYLWRGGVPFFDSLCLLHLSFKCSKVTCTQISQHQTSCCCT